MLISTRPCHIVQIGRDDKVFQLPRESESVQRQVTYGEVLERLRPNSTMTLVVLTRNKEAKPLRIGNVTFRPFAEDLRRWAKFKGWYHLYTTLQQIDSERKIDTLTTQTVHDEAWVALLFGKMRHRAVVGQIHSDIFNPYAKTNLSRGLMGHIRWPTLLFTLKHFTALRVVGQGIAAKIRERRLHFQVHVIPVTMPMLSANLPVANHMKKERKVLFVGRLAEEKNLLTWLRIAELVADEMPEAIFEIVGDGDLRKSLEVLVDRKGFGKKVKFRGFVDYYQLPEIYRSASVFLITSLYEGFGRVVAEALANRVPVVAAHITGVEDIVVHGRSGFLHPPFDVSGMAKSVIALLRNPSMAEEMGKFGEASVKEKFDPKTLAEKWVKMLVDYAS
jgi:glycosyltransferase involved in cell wall biosynthesis